MKCEELSNLVIDYLEDALEPDLRADLEGHVGTCEGCAAQLQETRQTWAVLGELPQEEPSPALRERFYAMLEAEQLEPAQDDSRNSIRSWFASFEFRSLLPQAMAAGLLLVAGIFIGSQMGSEAAPAEEGVDTLRAEVRSLSQLVTLSLLQQESASERLKGVRYGSVAAESDDEVLAALIDAVGHDASVNVRLAAIDALRPHVSQGTVHNSMLANLRSESSPLVQVSLVDALMEADGRETRESLESFAADENIDETVRAHVRTRLEKSA